MSDIRPEQSIELLKALHILTADAKLNQDSRRKLKQIYHLYNFIEPLLKNLNTDGAQYSVADHGAGKSYLGFILYDLFLKQNINGHIYCVETRADLIERSIVLQKKLNFERMSFLNITVNESTQHKLLPEKIDLVTALHACDTATDDAIDFALQKNAEYVVLIPCCQAEVAGYLRQNKKFSLKNPLVELYRSPIHTREFGSHLTNVLRCLKLEAAGYEVTSTELVGFEHSMKNELILAKKVNRLNLQSKERIQNLLEEFKIKELESRFLPN